MLLQIFLLYMYGNIYVYILNSICMITEHYVTWGLCWFCSDRVICCHKWTHSLQWFGSHLGIGLPPPPCSLFTLVVVCKKALGQWDFLCSVDRDSVSVNECGKIHFGKTLLGCFKSIAKVAMLHVVAGCCKAWEFHNTLPFQTSIRLKWEGKDPFLRLYFISRAYLGDIQRGVEVAL